MILLQNLHSLLQRECMTMPFIPMNSRPYRYSPLHKHEIEHQVKAFLTVGFISPSTSPYSSLMFISKKRMVTRGFVLII